VVFAGEEDFLVMTVLGRDFPLLLESLLGLAVGFLSLSSSSLLEDLPGAFFAMVKVLAMIYACK
jgi:hypothetical protein